uniref:Uncharacterized protein n=1 Tax=Romanomermis culicivorax TaxID=13658 RepID=A0A915HNJ5_ROMCU
MVAAFKALELVKGLIDKRSGQNKLSLVFCLGVQDAVCREENRRLSCSISGFKGIDNIEDDSDTPLLNLNQAKDQGASLCVFRNITAKKRFDPVAKCSLHAEDHALFSLKKEVGINRNSQYSEPWASSLRVPQSFYLISVAVNVQEIVLKFQSDSFTVSGTIGVCTLCKLMQESRLIQMNMP